MNAFTRTVRAKANKRIAKYTAITKDAADSTQQDVYGDIPGTANAPGFLGFVEDHFVEPGGLFFVAQGTDPTTVTGTVPGTYSLAGRNLTLRYVGEGFAIAAAGGINEGDELVIADAYGRVDLASKQGGAGTAVYPVAVALGPSAEANDIIRVKILDGVLRHM